MSSKLPLAGPALACLLAALTAVGAYIAVPFPGTPVPIVLQNLFIVLGALLLGPRWGTTAVLVYLGLGALGLPVFSGGRGGIVHFAGPTGGYLVGYIFASLAIAGISRLGRRALWKDILAALAGILLVYAFGLPWLKLAIKADWTKTLAAGFLPFVFGDILKALLAAILANRLRPLVEPVLGGPRRTGAGPGPDSAPGADA